MSNPFFVPGPYPWGHPAGRPLLQMLGQAITTTNAIVALYEQAGGDVSVLDQNGSPSDVWSSALNLLSAAGLMQALAEVLRAHQAVARRPELDAIFSAVSLVEGTLLDGDVLVLDRTNLRACIGRLERSTSPKRVVLVRGETKSGKTRGRHLFQQAAQQRGAQPLYLFAEIIPTVETLIQQLFSALGAFDDVPPPGLTTGPAYYQTVCMKLQSIAAKSDRQLWVAIDDLGPGPDGAPLLDPEIRLFCDTLALNTRNPLLGDRLRLMLINYPPGPLPSRWETDFFDEDRTSEADVDTAAVVEFLHTSATARLREDEAREIAETVIATADADPVHPEASPYRLQRVHDALKAALRGIK